MDELEQEYRDNLQRVKQREDRRRVLVLALYVAVMFASLLADIIRGELSARNVVLAFVLTVVFGGLSMFRLAQRLFKRFEDRNVEVATTERERGYREAIVTRGEDVRAPTKPRLLALLALIPLGVATFAFGAAMDAPHVYRADRVIALGTTITMMGIILVGKRLYGAWRERRNARLELQWEKWLDSADSCEVGPRKWTK